jgi:hypothetical protein
MTIIVGIDSGASGAIALLDSDTGELLAVDDMPVDKVQTGKHVRSRLNRNRTLELLHRARGAQAFVERPDYRPMRQTNKATGQTEERQIGSAGAGSFGEHYGGVTMAAAAAGMSITEVRAGAWKKSIGASGDKDTVRRRSQELWPAQAHRFSRKKDDGRGDACLLAYYGMLTLRGKFHVDRESDAEVAD